MNIVKLNRRQLLASTAAIAAAAAMPRGAFAQSGSMVASVFGGDYADILREAVDLGIMEPMGVEVIQDVISGEARQTKLRTELNSRRSSMDVAVLADLDMFPIAELGAFAPITEAEVPRLAAVIPALRKDYAVPQIYSYIAILYNPAMVETPPTSYADLWDPKYKGKVGVSDILHMATSAVAAIVGGGSVSDFEPGQEKLLELRDQQEVRIYPSNETIAAALQSGEIWITVNYVARAYSWKNAGVPIEHAVASEGAIPIAFEMAVPKNARNPEAGFAYLDAALSPAAQSAFTTKMGYLPTVTDAELDPAIAAQLTLSEEDQSRLLQLDYTYLMENNTAILDFWTREFKA